MAEYSDKFVDTGLKGEIQHVIHDGVYLISPIVCNNEVLGIHDKSVLPYMSLNSSKFTGEAHQMFIIKYNKKDDYFTLMPLNSFLYLGVEKKQDSNYNTSEVVQYSESDDHLSNWQIYLDDHFSIQLKGTNYYFEYNKDSNSINLAKKSNSDAQKFKIYANETIQSGLYYINSISPQQLYITFSKVDQTQNSYLCAKSQSDNQIFYVVFDKHDGCYSIINMSNVKSFSTSRNTTSESKISQTSFYNLDHQKWIIGKYDNKIDNFFIIHKSSNLLLCNTEADSENQIYLSLRNYDWKSSNDNFQFQPFYRSLLNFSKTTEEKKMEKYKDKIHKMIDHRYWTKITPDDMSKLKNSFLNREFLENCVNLVELEIPNDFISIDDQALINCTRIKTIKTHPKWLKFLPNPNNVENIIVQQDTEIIENDYFQNFHNLKYLSLPQSLKISNCDKDAFKNIYGLTSFEGDPIFLNLIHKDGITKLYIPNYVKEIPEDICSGCKVLNEIHIEKDTLLKSIKSRAFADCESLRYFLVPESVDNIAPDAFIGCNKNLDLITNEKQKLSMIENLVIDPSKMDIGNEYKYYVNISSLEIPLEVQNCNTGIFKKFDNLKYVKCHPKWLSLFNPENIEVVFIPNKVNQIKNENFDEFVHLKFIEIPETVEQIEQGTFDNCKELTSVKCGTKHFKYLNKKLIKTISLNEQTTRISVCDFEGFTNLETIQIPKSVNYVSPNVFSNCKKLMNVKYPKGETLINNSVQIEEDKTEILREDFEGWTNLKTLIIPNSITKIEEGTFNDCVNLKCITCDPKWFPFIPKNSIRKVIIPDFVKEIKKGQFDDFYSMVYIKLPKDIEIDDMCIFDSCESLKIIKCQNSVFSKLSDKTIERCDQKIRLRYEHPIFNFQPDPSKIHDETDLIEEKKLDDTMFMTFANTIYSTMAQTSNAPRNTTVDDLIALDPKINQFRPYINKVLWAIQSGEINRLNKPSDTSITEITNVCGYILYEIHKEFKIIPRINQIYTVLYLADEILNNKESHGSIAEVKSGEGKTFIITILAIILVKYGHTVDITKSNLRLAKQDRIEQDRFFNLFHIKTSVFYDKRTDLDLLTRSVTFRAPEYFNEYKGYDQSEFTNFNLKAFDCPVVYSTNRNYEYYYLHTLFSMIPRKRTLDIVLIDEVDNMLIDEIESPANISKEINFASAQNIFCIVYATRFLKVAEIAKLLKKEFPNASEFKEEEVELLRNAALEADNKIKDVDYIVKNKDIIIIDQNTGYTMPNSHWQNYVHEMVEIKEYIKPGPASITFCQVTQQSYFNLYNKIAGVTSTIGTEFDEKILNDGYNINCIKVPRNVPSNIEFYYKKRPESIDDIYELVNEEIFTQRLKGRPVLVIWDSKYNAENFKKVLNVKKVGMIIGENPDDDEIAINDAGKAKTVTIATLAAGRNVTIKQTNESLRAGGLHVIIPMKLSNLRSLEQAVGRTGRNGQPGSVLILISEDDLYIQTPQFKQGNNNLVKLELRFAEYIRNHFSWLLCGPGKNEFYGNAKYPFAASYSDIMHILSCRLSLIFRHLTDLNKFQDLSWKMVQTSWGVFFTKLLNDKLNHDNWTYCEKEYIRFIKELNNYMNPNECRSINGAMQYMRTHFQDDSNKDFIIYKGLKISTDNVELIPSIGKNQTSDLIDDSNPTKKKEIFAIPKGIKKLKDTYDWIKQKINENKKSIPNKSILNKTPSIEIENFDIDLIKTAMTFANEAYNYGEFSIGRVIYGCETNELYKPKFYCVEHSNNLFVATKGSSNDVDYLTDISCYEVCEKINGNVYYFHNGFYSSAKYILSNIEEYLDRDYKNIYFVGHSLAAAVSNVLCFLTKTDEKYKDKKIFSLAFAPPPSMSRVPAFVQDCMYSFINKEDVIPHLSLSNILNTINLKEIDFETYLDMFIKLCKSSMIKKAQDISNLLEKHKKEIVKTFHAIKDDLHVNKNIGNIFFIGFADSTKLRNYQIDETDLQNTVFIPPSLIAHHAMDDYIKTFEIIKSY